MRVQCYKRSMPHFRLLFEVKRRQKEDNTSHSQQTSDVVDQLLEWAVINQSLFPFPEVKHQILKESLEQSTARKRQ